MTLAEAQELEPGDSIRCGNTKGAFVRVGPLFKGGGPVIFADSAGELLAFYIPDCDTPPKSGRLMV